MRVLSLASEVVGVDKVGEVGLELLVAVVVVALDGGLLDGAVHALDLPVRPGVIQLGEAMLDAVLVAAHVEHVRHVTGRRSSAYRCGKVNWMPLSVSTVWIL